VVLLNNYIIKRIISIALCVSVLSAVVLLNPVDVNAQQIRVTVDGIQVNFPDAQPVIVGDRTLVPMRGVFEQMGFIGNWNPNTYTSTLVRSGTTVSVRRGDAFFMVNGVQYFPEVPPQLLGGRFMIPLRAIAEATGAHVDWNDHTRTVIITTTPMNIEPMPMPTVPPLTPTISIAPQAGQMIAGTVSSANFNVTTQRVPNGNYQVALRGNLPTGVTLHDTNININNNSGILRLNGSNATQQGTFVVTVSINLGGNAGWVDRDLSLVISPPPANQGVLNVGTQSGILSHGMSGSVSYALTSQNLANGNYNISLTSPVPQGISLGSNTIAINNNSGTLVLNTNGNTPVGNHTVNFSLTRGTGAQSVTINRSATFTVAQQNQGIRLNVGNQNGTLSQGTSGFVSYPLTTQNLANGNYSVSLTGQIPQGVSLGSNNINITNNSGTLTLNTNNNTPAGTHTVNFSLTRGTGAQAVTVNRSATLTVGSQAQNFTLNVGNQNGALTQGIPGSVSYPITSQNLPNGNHSISLTGQIPQGVSLGSSNLHINNNSGTLTLHTNSSTPAGNHTVNFSVTRGSGAQAVTVTRSATLTVGSQAQNIVLNVGSQSGTLSQGDFGSVSYNVTTQNLPNGNYSMTLASPIPQGISLASNNLSISNNSGSIVVNSNGTTPVGNHTILLAVTVGSGAQAVTLNRQMTLTISPAAVAVPTITSGTQANSVDFGSVQQVVFTFNVQNTLNGDHQVTMSNQPAGVTLVGNLVVNNNTATLVLNVDTQVMAGPGSSVLNFQTNMPNSAGASAGWIPFSATLTVN